MWDLSEWDVRMLSQNFDIKRKRIFIWALIYTTFTLHPEIKSIYRQFVSKHWQSVLSTDPLIHILMQKRL